MCHMNRSDVKHVDNPSSGGASAGGVYAINNRRASLVTPTTWAFATAARQLAMAGGTCLAQHRFTRVGADARIIGEVFQVLSTYRRASRLGANSEG
jgi:hypothetical protein